jgi:hypothetical protein
MKLTFALLGLLVVGNWATAALWIVAADGSQPYAQVQPAIDAANAGDTIIVCPGVYSSGFTVDRKLILFGAGTSLSENEGTLIAGPVTFTDNADSSELVGFTISAASQPNPPTNQSDLNGAVLRISANATSIFVCRCFIENTQYQDSHGWVMCVWIGVNADLALKQCVLYLPRVTGTCFATGIWTEDGSSYDIQSSIIARCSYVTHGFAVRIAFRHCLILIPGFEGARFANASWLSTGFFEDCAFFSDGNIQFHYNPVIRYLYCASNPNLPSGIGNISLSSADLVNYNFSDPRMGDYHLALSTVCRDAGNPNSPADLDGSRADIGIYGGMHPYVDDGIPPYPFAIGMDAPTWVPQNGVMRIWAKGRVGPGN